MLMVLYRQTQLLQLPCLIYAKSAQWIKNFTAGEWSWHSVTTRTLLGAGGGHGSVGVGSAFGRQLSSRSRQAGPHCKQCYSHVI